MKSVLNFVGEAWTRVMGLLDDLDALIFNKDTSEIVADHAFRLHTVEYSDSDWKELPGMYRFCSPLAITKHLNVETIEETSIPLLEWMVSNMQGMWWWNFRLDTSSKNPLSIVIGIDSESDAFFFKMVWYNQGTEEY
jgi:hypothetical protein